MTDVHAKLSPSGAHRWMECPGSVVLERNFPDEGSVYADEGSAAHLLASWCLTDNLDPSNYLNENISIGERKFKVDEDMCNYVRDYVKLVKGYAENGHLLVEQAVSIEHITGEPGAKGTSDAIIVHAAEKRMTVIDLKYGMGVRVDAEFNPQLMLYALGAYEVADLIAEIERVTMVVHMPRLNHVSEWEIPLETLLAFGNDAMAYAAETRQAEADEAMALTTLDMDSTSWSEQWLRPGEKQCRFCKAKAVCPALRSAMAEVVGGSAPATVDDFKEFLPMEMTTDVGDNYLSIAMDKVGLVEDWCKAVRAEVERRLFAGQTVNGYKLVEGKKGPRKWIDEDAAIKVLKSAKLKQSDIFKQTLISPTEAEKRLKGSPQFWAKAQGVITQSAGKPSVAPATDKRPELAITAVAEDFQDLVSTEKTEVDN